MFSYFHRKEKIFKSLIFRLVLVFYALMFVCEQTTNYFSTIFYMLISLAYALSFFVTRKKTLIRLLLLLIYIFLCLLGRDVTIPVNYIFLLLPVINSINYSGKERNTGVLYVGIVFIMVTLLYVNGERNIFKYLYDIIPISPLFCIDCYSWRQKKKKEKITETLDIIDDFFVVKDTFGVKPHTLYALLRDNLNQKLNMEIYDISCYTFTHEDYWIINSLNFKFDRKLKLNKEEIENVEKNDFCRNNLSGQNQCRMIFRVKIKDNIFLFDVYTDLRNLYDKEHLFPILFNKIAKQFLQEFRLREYREETYTKYRENRDYVNSALEVMHFLRNYLSPLKNVLSMYDPNSVLIITDELDKIRRKELQTAKESLNKIVDEADRLLDKKRNPFADTSLEEKSVRHLYNLLAETCQYMLNIEVIRDFEPKDLELLTVKISSVGVRVLFSDWIGNMKKASPNFCEVHFYIDNTNVAIDFMNKININSFDYNIIKEINQKDKTAILQRRSHGIYNLITGAEELNVELSVCIIENSIIKLTLKFPTYEKESINN